MRVTGETSRRILSLFMSCLFFLGLSGLAQAGRPMETDDADILDAGSCQLETWVDRHRDSTEFWLAPACNPGGNMELTIGAAWTRQASSTTTSALAFQAKTVLKPMQPDGWGAGLAAGLEHHPKRTGEGRDWYAYLPVSRSFRDDRLLLHANLGWLHDGEDKRNRMTWGIGTEFEVAERTWMMLETFGHDQGKPSYQLGFAYWLISDRVQLDAAFGQGLDRDENERWFSLGLTLVSFP